MFATFFKNKHTHTLMHTEAACVNTHFTGFPGKMDAAAEHLMRISEKVVTPFLVTGAA